MSYLIELARQIIEYLRRVIRQPIDELTEAQRMLRFMVDLCRHGARELNKDRAFEMAAALTYRTIFSLVPIALLSMLIFRAFVPLENAQQWMRETAHDFVGWSTVQASEKTTEGSEAAHRDGNDATDEEENPPVEAPDVESAPPAPASEGAATREPPPEPTVDEKMDPAGAQEDRQALAGKFRSALDARMNELLASAWELNLGRLGIAGSLLLIWAAVALLVTVEDSFNTVYGCPSGRSWFSRLIVYWSVISLGPVVIALGSYGLNKFIEWGTETRLLGPLTDAMLGFLDSITGFLAMWFLLLVMYLLMPNTVVHKRPAVIGSLVSAGLWSFGQWAFHWYVTTALPYSALYGSLALIPIFLFWLYLNWLMVLFGLELTYTLQMLHGKRFEEQEASKYKDRLMCNPQWFISMMVAVAENFQRGETATTDQLSRQLELPTRTVALMAARLEEERLLNRVEQKVTGELSFSLARPPEQISIGALLELGRRVTGTQSKEHPQLPGWPFLQSLIQAQQRQAEDATLATVLAAQ